MTARVRAFALVALVPALAACGGGSNQDDEAARPMLAAGSSARAGRVDTRRADAGSARTIDAWVRAERNSEHARAASYFSLPAIVLNGPEPFLLRSRADVRRWNQSLPCGAILLRTVDVRGWTIARFRLIDRPGSHCDGTTRTASTAFAMRRGKIAMWIRVRDDVTPAKAAPSRHPDAEFLRKGTIGGRPVPPEAGAEDQSPSA